MLLNSSDKCAVQSHSADRPWWSPSPSSSPETGKRTRRAVVGGAKSEGLDGYSTCVEGEPQQGQPGQRVSEELQENSGGREVDMSQLQASQGGALHEAR